MLAQGKAKVGIDLGRHQGEQRVGGYAVVGETNRRQRTRGKSLSVSKVIRARVLSQGRRAAQDDVRLRRCGSLASHRAVDRWVKVVDEGPRSKRGGNDSRCASARSTHTQLGATCAGSLRSARAGASGGG